MTWIDENNPVRVIDAFVEALNLAELGFAGVEPEAASEQHKTFVGFPRSRALANGTFRLGMRSVCHAYRPGEYFPMLAPRMPAAITSLASGTARERPMALQDIEPNTKSPINDLDADAELEAGLIKLTPFLRAFAVSLSGKRDLADDLAQEALTKAWRSRRAFVPGSNLKAWVFTILRNEYYSQQRRAWRQTGWDQELAEAMPALSDQHWALELSDIASAMQALPDAQRKALLLVGAGGFSYEEAAKHTRMALGTVKSRVARARQALKIILDGQNPRPIKWGPAKGNAMNEILSQLVGMNALDGDMRSNVR